MQYKRLFNFFILIILSSNVKKRRKVNNLSIFCCLHENVYSYSQGLKWDSGGGETLKLVVMGQCREINPSSQ